MTAPIVTIGLTCYNAEDTIRRAIRGAVSQGWPNIEVIVVDDASRDGSVAVANAEIGGSTTARLVCHSEN